MPTQLDHYRLLGRSGLRVSPLSLGTMTFGVPGEWGSSPEEAGRIFGLYCERGGNFIDTADFYGNYGGSERELARLIKPARDSLVVATKYSLTTRPGDPNASGNHRKNMVRSVEASLRRMETDYIDLLYLHMWDYRTPVEEILRGFDDLVRSGKIVYAGISDTPAWQIARMQMLADLRGWSPFVALQIPYNLTERTVERDLMPMALELGLGVLPWSPLAGGILSGKYSRKDLGGTAVTDIKAINTRKDINRATGKLTEKALTIADLVGDVATEIGVSPAQVALAWTMLHPSVVSPLLGVRTLAQLQDNLAALDVQLDDGHIARLAAASAVELGFPHDLLQSKPSMAMTFGGVTVEERQTSR